MALSRADLPRDQDTALIFLDESGEISGDRFFALGCLKLTDTATLLRRLLCIRGGREMHNELHFCRLTLDSLAFYKEIVDILAAAQPQFTCVVVDREKADPFERYRTWWEAYEKLAVEAIVSTVRASEVVTVLADNCSELWRARFEGSSTFGVMSGVHAALRAAL